MRFHRPLARVRRRLRLQAAFEGGALAAVVAGAIALVGVYLWRLHLYGTRGLLVVGLTAGGVVLAGVVARAIARIPLDRAALQIDQSHQLHDRLRSALAFSEEAVPTPFMQAALADAEEAAKRVEMRASRAAGAARGAGAGGDPRRRVAARRAVAAFRRALTRRRRRRRDRRTWSVDRGALDPEREAARALAAEAPEDAATSKGRRWPRSSTSCCRRSTPKS